jgi:hypothetical protein
MSTVSNIKQKIGFKEMTLEILDILARWVPQILIIVLGLIGIGVAIFAFSVIIPISLHGGNLYWNVSMKNGW